MTTTQLNAFAETGIVMPTPVPGVTKLPGSGRFHRPTKKPRDGRECIGRLLSTGAGQRLRRCCRRGIEYRAGRAISHRSDPQTPGREPMYAARRLCPQAAATSFYA